MKEIYEFRINDNFSHLLFSKDEGKELEDLRIINITKDDPRFYKIGEIQNKIDKRDNLFYYSWYIRREYTKPELDSAKLLQIKFKNWYTIWPEEYGTKYNKITACEICGVGATLIGPLKISKSKVPKRDIAILLGSEVVVSNKLVEIYNKYGLKGADFRQVYSGKNPVESYQLLSESPFLSVSDKTETGITPFDSLEDKDNELFICPRGHTIGLNDISELYIKKIPSIEDFDFFITYEKIGKRRNALRQRPFYLCSQKFREMVEREKLNGFIFEVAHIV